MCENTVALTQLEKKKKNYKKKKQAGLLRQTLVSLFADDQL